MNNKVVLKILFLAICGPIIQGLFKGLHFELLANISSYIDEISVIIIFSFTIISKGLHNQKVISVLVLLLYLIGLISGKNSVFDIKVNFLGAFNNLKSILLFICLCQYSFRKSEIYNFIHYFIYFFPLIFVSYIVEFLIPSFRDSVFDFGNFGVSFRSGMRIMGGLFPVYTYATLWGFVMYVIYQVYMPKENFSTLKKYFSFAMIFLTLKVKDMIAGLMSFVVLKSRQIKPHLIVVYLFVFYLAFSVYQIFMPDHYDTYFGEHRESAVRNIMTGTSIVIANSYFPLGVGWGKFGSATSAQFYSEVYKKYRIDGLWGLNYDSNHSFMQDNQFPMFIGETGWLGFALFISIVLLAFGPYLIKFANNTKDPRYALPAVLFIYFAICVMGKPVFVSVPHSFVIWGFAGIFYNYSLYHDTKNRSLLLVWRESDAKELSAKYRRLEKITS